MDSNTIKEEMVKVRLCVEINAEDDLPDEIPALVGKSIEKIPISYGWRPTGCSVYTTFGHVDSTCLSKSASSSSTTQEQETIQGTAVCRRRYCKH